MRPLSLIAVRGGETLYCRQSDPKPKANPVVNLKFGPIELSGFPSLETEEFFGKQDPNSSVFIDAFMPGLEAKFGAKIEQVQLFNGGQSRASLAFIYFEDLSIRSVEFSGDQNLKSWFAAFAEGFGGSTLHRVDDSGLDTSRFTAWDDLTANPSDWSKRKAPNSHRKTELVDEKTKFFGFKPGNANTDFDSANFQSVFATFLNSRGAKASTPNSTDLAALEAAVGTALPQDFKALYGATDGIKEVFHGFDLLSASDAKAQHESWMAIYNDWTLEALQSQQRAEAGIYPVYFNPRWIPFVDLVGGNYLAIDLGPATGGTYGQIITMGRDVDGKRRVAKSLTEFLQKSATYDGSKNHELYSVFGRLKF